MRADTTYESVEAALQHYSTDWTFEQLREILENYQTHVLGQRETFLTRNTNFNDFMSEHVILENTRSALENFGYKDEKVIHHMLPKVKNADLYKDLAGNIKVIHQTYAMIFFLIKKGYISIAQYEMKNLKKVMQDFSREVSSLKLKKSKKAEIIIEVLKSSYELGHKANGPWSQRENYHIEETLEDFSGILQSYRPLEYLKDFLRFKWQTFFYGTTVPGLVLLGLAAGFFVSALMAILGDGLNTLLFDGNNSDAIKDSYKDAVESIFSHSWKPVCGLTAAAACYYSWGKMKTRPMFPSLKKTVRQYENSCRSFLSERFL